MNKRGSNLLELRESSKYFKKDHPNFTTFTVHRSSVAILWDSINSFRMYKYLYLIGWLFLVSPGGSNFPAHSIALGCRSEYYIILLQYLRTKICQNILQLANGYPSTIVDNAIFCCSLITIALFEVIRYHVGHIQFFVLDSRVGNNNKSPDTNNSPQKITT